MAALVEAAAPVEDAVPLLLDSTDLPLCERACILYIKRMYHPFLIEGPHSIARVGTALIAAFRWVFDAAARPAGACEPLQSVVFRVWTQVVHSRRICEVAVFLGFALLESSAFATLRASAPSTGITSKPDSRMHCSASIIAPCFHP